MADEWSLDLRKYAQDTIEKTRLVMRKTAFEICRRVILRTPVDTGRARNNWFTSVGSASSQVTDNAGKTGSARINDASRACNSWDVLQSIYLTNNLPYIEVLENGRVGNRGSTQAPNGMVGITVAEFDAIVSRTAASGWRDGWDVGGAGE